MPNQPRHRPDSLDDPDELRGRLHATQSQLALYVKDLKVLLAREEKKTRQLMAANRQLQYYARDLKAAFDAEQCKARELEQAYADTLVRLALASRYKDEETGAHIRRLSHYARTLALYVELDPQEADRLFAAAPMHDVGKVGVPDAIMLKRGPLDEDEWEMVKRHPELGANLLAGSGSSLLQLARDIAWTHHERWDGSGYPRGLRGEQIPLGGRIVMLADTYDALRSPRPYKPSFSHKKTCQIMLDGNERTQPTHFDPLLLEAFREMHSEFDAIFSMIREDVSQHEFVLTQDASGSQPGATPARNPSS